jgi:hypothetical protein
MENDTNFSTSDFNLAACFMADGIKYLRVERDPDPARYRRLIFFFENNSQIPTIMQQRANGTHVVSSTVLEEMQRRMKSIIYGVK